MQVFIITTLQNLVYLFFTFLKQNRSLTYVTYVAIYFTSAKIRHELVF